ncbi:helix-turn-helix domain-containing protein [Chitinivorax sp. B]|uniref:GlxA family transcriptional regulator n=1 Tax=Chitinivorax sp. B TaxID=2502235 RepID=UPI0010F9FB29|nr:helix-turn-helix domain-containing protein [Chitinivorax sp. B]
MLISDINQTIAVVVFPGISPFHLSVPCMVFGDDLGRLGVPRYQLRVCAPQPGRIPTLAGFDIEVSHDLSAIQGAGTVIVPAWPDPDVTPPDSLLQALRDAHTQGSRVVGLCLGAFVLAEAGLLDGLVASTHWAWCGDFARKYPKVKLDSKALYVDEGHILTSAGTAAAIDCCLHLLRRDCGADVANRVARRMVVAPHRHGGQAQYIEYPVPITEGADTLTIALDWAVSNLHTSLTVDSLADKAAMSRRNFTRRFKQKTGTTVVQWLLNQRLRQAQLLLETSDHSVDRIAELTGFGSTVSLRQHFTRTFVVSPAVYRKQFKINLGR